MAGKKCEAAAELFRAVIDRWSTWCARQTPLCSQDPLGVENPRRASRLDRHTLVEVVCVNSSLVQLLPFFSLSARSAIPSSLAIPEILHSAPKLTSRVLLHGPLQLGLRYHRFSTFTGR